jgi:HTH-type transcriptional regulator/antitoxin HigA
MPAKIKSRMPGAMPKTLDRLVQMMPPMAVRDDVQHANTLEVIDRLMQIEPLSRDQSDYLETLLELVEAYEAKHYAIDVSKITGLQSLKHLIEESRLSGSDLARLLDMHPTMGSKILNGDRKLTWEHAKKLGARFKVMPSLFMD